MKDSHYLWQMEREEGFLRLCLMLIVDNESYYIIYDITHTHTHTEKNRYFPEGVRTTTDLDLEG